MDKKRILEILEGAKDDDGEIPMSLVRKAFEKIKEPCTDAVSRQAAIDEIKSVYDYEYPTASGAFDEFVTMIIPNIIKNLPSAEPEIIRCKECKYWQDQEEGIVEVQICARPANKYEKFPLVMLIGGDGFCSYAERKENR